MVAASQSAKGGLGAAHLEVIEDAKAATLLAVAKETIAPGARGAPRRLQSCFGRLLGQQATSTTPPYWQVAKRHRRVAPLGGRIVLANFKRSVFSTSSTASPRLTCRPSLDEFCYRLDHSRSSTRHVSLSALHRARDICPAHRRLSQRDPVSPKEGPWLAVVDADRRLISVFMLLLDVTIVVWRSPAPARLRRLLADLQL